MSATGATPRPRGGMSLRNRIALHYTAATALLVALVFAALYGIVGRTVYAEFDRTLQREARALLGKAHIHPDRFRGFEHLEKEDDKEERRFEWPGSERSGRRGPLRTELIQLSLPDGTPLRRSPNLGSAQLEVEPSRQQRTIFSTTAGGLPVRQVQVPLRQRDGRLGGWLTVARPIRDADAVLGDLRRVLLFSFPAILITLFILTRSIAGRSIRPVEEAIATAEAITREHLDRRIPLPRNHDELYRLSSTLNDLLDRLEEAFRREKQFTADASHELKTPLAAVMGTLEVLLRKPRTTQHYQERIGTALDELARMSRLIDQLLLLARHEHGAIAVHIGPTELHTALLGSAARLEAAATARTIAIDTTRIAPAMVQADPELLGLMLDNLLANALKYSPSGSTVTLTAQTGREGVACHITDQGEGIPEHEREAVFERFYRLDSSRSTATGGFGLGLAIVKKLADLQGIDLAITGAPGTGTTMRLIWHDKSA